MQDPSRFGPKAKVLNDEYFQDPDEPHYSFRDMVRDLATDVSVPEDRMIRGCQVFMPETLFYREGKIDYVAALDKDFCLHVDPKRPMDRVSLEILFASKAKERRQDNTLFSMTKNLVNKQNRKSSLTIPFKDPTEEP